MLFQVREGVLKEYNYQFTMHMVHEQLELPLETREWGEYKSKDPCTQTQKQTTSSAFTVVSLDPETRLKQYSDLGKMSAKLEKEIQEAKQEQTMMLDFFEEILKAEQGQQFKSKKGKRRRPQETFERFECPHCPRYYTSDSSLKRHFRLKHDQLGDDPPQNHPALTFSTGVKDLEDILEHSKDDKNFEQDLSDNQRQPSSGRETQKFLGSA